MTDPPGDPSRNAARRQGIAYQGAFEAFVAILIAMGLGYWVDQHFETSPIYLLIGTAVGFAAFVLRLFRLGRQLQNLGDPANPATKDPQ